MKQHILQTGSAQIVIQSCDDNIANIGVFKRKSKSAYHHVLLPSLERERTKPLYPTELSDVEYDEVLQQNKQAVLQRICCLNESFTQ